MAGIRVLEPKGEGWEYSLDDLTWQEDTLFPELAPGVAFVIGQEYVVYSRNVAEVLITSDHILFGLPTNDDTLDRVTKRNPFLKSNIIVQGNVNILFEELPGVAQGQFFKKDGVYWAYAGKLNNGNPGLVINGHSLELTPTGQLLLDGQPLVPAAPAAPGLSAVTAIDPSTTDLVELLGGIVATLPETGDASLPTVVIGPGNRLMRRGGVLPLPATPVLTFGAHYVAVPAVLLPATPVLTFGPHYIAVIDTVMLINVAAGKPVSAPAQNNGVAWQASHVTDQNPLTNYTTDCLTEFEEAIIRVDLLGLARPSRIEIIARQDDPGALPINYVLEGSLDNLTWFLLHSVTGQARTKETILLPVPATAGVYPQLRYIRLRSSRNGQATNDCRRVQLAELRVMAPMLLPLPNPGPIINRYPDTVITQPGYQSIDLSSVFANVDPSSWRATGGGDEPLPAGFGFLSGSHQLTITEAVIDQGLAIKLHATDLNGTPISSAFLLTIARNVVPPRYEIGRTISGSQTVAEGTTQRYRLLVSFSDNTTEDRTLLSDESIEGWRPGETISNEGDISIPPNSVQGDNHDLTVVFVQGGVRTPRVIQVVDASQAPTNPPPVFNGYGPITITAAGDQTFVVPASVFSDTDALTWLAATTNQGAALPNGLTFNPATRTFTVPAGYPSVQQALRLAVRDTANQTAFGFFLLKVERVAATPKVNRVWLRDLGVSGGNLRIRLVAMATAGIEYQFAEDLAVPIYGDTWTGTILPTSTVPVDATVGSSITRPAGSHNPFTLRLRVVDHPESVITVPLKTSPLSPLNTWIEVYTAP